jgi:Cu2+-exporting ATPase
MSTREKNAAALRSCIHCGTPFRPTEQRADFCCAGCQFVHDLIVKNGLGQFYDLQENVGAPVKSLVFQKRDYAWLAEIAKIAEAVGGPVAALELDLQGISCIGCVWLIEKIFMKKPGALSIQVNSAVGRLQLRWQSGALDVVAFAKEIQAFGYLVAPAGKSPALESRALVTRIGLCAAFAMNTMLFTLPGYLGMTQGFEYAALFNKLTVAFSTLSFVIGGSYFFSRTILSMRNRVLHIDLPISLGLVAAYAGSLYAWHAGRMNFAYFDFVSIFVFLMLVGRWLQQSAIEKNRNRLLGLQTFVRESDHELKPGQAYAVGAGQVIPVRSKLLSNGATLGLEWINGEAEAQAARIGQIVPSGAVNFSPCSVQLEAMEGWTDSILSKLLHVTPRDDFKNHGLENFIKYYIIVIIAVAAAGFGGWLAATHQILPALQALTAILVVSCPCAAGVALPLADELGVSALRKLGVFVREQSLWTRILRVKKIIFDKTGTLTLETLALRNADVLKNLAPHHKQVLLHMVGDNLHPISGCLRENLLASGAWTDIDGEVSETVGFGLQMETADGIWRLGRPEWSSSQNQPAGHECEFSLNNKTLARFSFAEEVRADAAEEVARLQAAGYSVHILSGDRRHKVDAMAKKLGLPAAQCESEMSPDDKARWVRTLDRRDTLMIGDGANDSLAFNESYCNGTPAIDRGLLEQKSDFYFLGRGLNGVRELLEAGKRRRTTVRRVIAFALTYNFCTILVSLAGRMNPLAAAILMPVSSLVSVAIVYLGCSRPSAQAEPRPSTRAAI